MDGVEVREASEREPNIWIKRGQAFRHREEQYKGLTQNDTDIAKKSKKAVMQPLFKSSVVQV